MNSPAGSQPPMTVEPPMLGRTWMNFPCCHWKTNAAAAPFSPSASNLTGPWTLFRVTPLCR